MKRLSKKLNPARPPGKTELRRIAETQLRRQGKNAAIKTGMPKTKTEMLRLLHELQVYQVELEMQNEELQKARNEMETGLDRYTDLYDFAPVGYFTLAPDSKIQMVNLTGARLVGMERSRLLGQPFLRNVVANFKPDFIRFLKRVFASDAKQSCEAKLLGADQIPRSVNIEGHRSPDGRECHAVVMDITERQRASEAVMRLAAVVQNTDDAIYTETFDGIIISWNKGAERMFDYSAQEILGHNISVLVPPTRAGEADLLIKKLRDGKRILNYETERMAKNGTLVSVSLSIALLRDQTGKGTGVSVIARDITESKQAEASLRHLEVLAVSNRKLQQEIGRRQVVEDTLKQSEKHQRQLLEQAHQAQEQLRHLSRKFLRAQEDERKRISRELHDVVAQTLTGINVRLATLKKEAAHKTTGLSRSIASTQRLVEKSVDIVHQFARELRPAVLDDLGLIPALHSFVKTFSKQTGIRIHMTAFAGLEKLDSAKRTVLYRIAQESLANVANHAHASRVDINIQGNAKSVRMQIKDDGRSFNVGEMSQASRNKRLGLLGMKERLEMVGGTFSIESAPHIGTTVTAQIPMNTETKEGDRP